MSHVLEIVVQLLVMRLVVLLVTLEIQHVVQAGDSSTPRMRLAIVVILLVRLVAVQQTTIACHVPLLATCAIIFVSHVLEIVVLRLVMRLDVLVATVEIQHVALTEDTTIAPL